MNEKRANPNFSILTHANGTKTLVDSENKQAMHSRIGPAEEAKLLYADLARIEESLMNPSVGITLYDVGMGTSANVLAVLDRIATHSSRSGMLRIFSFETKPKGLRTALDAAEDFPLLNPWRGQLESLLKNETIHFSLGGVQVEWQLVTRDFYVSYPRLPVPDFIFFDFYSPKAVPELWSQEKFRDLRKHLEQKKCRLFTYAAATSVRVDLLLAGFFVGQGGSTEMKNESTVAVTHPEFLEKPLTSAWLEHKLKTSKTVAESPNQDELKAHPQWSIPAPQEASYLAKPEFRRPLK